MDRTARFEELKRGLAGVARKDARLKLDVQQLQ
jgi:hypothetical protein